MQEERQTAVISADIQLILRSRRRGEFGETILFDAFVNVPSSNSLVQTAFPTECTVRKYRDVDFD